MQVPSGRGYNSCDAGCNRDHINGDEYFYRCDLCNYDCCINCEDNCKQLPAVLKCP